MEGGQWPHFLRSISSPKHDQPTGPDPIKDGQQFLLGPGLFSKTMTAPWPEAPPK